MDNPRFKIEWIDAEREPVCASDPRYPDGIDVDASKSDLTCTVPLPYPAKRCGYFMLHCETCHQDLILTTAGRPDDPRSVKLDCKTTKEAHA